jgi:hypothetical protein
LREKSGERKRGIELEKKTMEIISEASMIISKDSGMYNSNSSTKSLF